MRSTAGCFSFSVLNADTSTALSLGLGSISSRVVVGHSAYTLRKIMFFVRIFTRMATIPFTATVLMKTKLLRSGAPTLMTSEALISDISSVISPFINFTDPNNRALRRAADLEIAGDGGNSMDLSSVMFESYCGNEILGISSLWFPTYLGVTLIAALFILTVFSIVDLPPSRANSDQYPSTNCTPPRRAIEEAHQHLLEYELGQPGI